MFHETDQVFECYLENPEALLILKVFKNLEPEV
jgi:hypothetical protein